MIIIYDFEVFKQDVLLGAILVDGDKREIFQSWNIEQIVDFYNTYNNNSIWVGHNNKGYDRYIMQAILQNKNIYETSQHLVNDKDDFLPSFNINMINYDLMSNHFGSLKACEAAMGKNISESEIDFNIDRPLNNEEKWITESYNRDDLNQTLDDYLLTKDELQLRIDVCNEFHKPLSYVSLSEAKLSSLILGVHRVFGIENMPIKPPLYPNLKLKNPQVWDYYLNEKFKTKEKLKVDFCGVPHLLGDGGIHSGKKGQWDWAYYFDVSGYYNLIMIKYNLLSRGFSEEGKKLYQYMYEEQLRLKKINPRKRKVYKIILLAVYGAMSNQHTDFYDPYKRSLVTITGQIFLCDLLEKLEGKVDLIQSNTDGIIAKPLPGISDDELKSIIKEWMDRTGFTLKLEKIYNITQRDVNNYMYQTENGDIHALGEAVKHYGSLDNPFLTNSFMSKEPLIIHYCIVNYFIKHINPEDTINQYKNDLRMFQYIVKKGSFDWLELQVNKNNGEIEAQKLQKVNRCFASNDKDNIGMIYKRRKEGKLQKAKVSNLPSNVFIYNEDIRKNDIIEKLKFKIDFDYYLKRAYERIIEFIE